MRFRLRQVLSDGRSFADDTETPRRYNAGVFEKLRMPEPKRRWFQLHLSTCIVLMFVAGVMLWANLRTGQLYDSRGDCHGRQDSKGWPCGFYANDVKPGIIVLNISACLLLLAVVATISESSSTSKGYATLFACIGGQHRPHVLTIAAYAGSAAAIILANVRPNDAGVYGWPMVVAETDASWQLQRPILGVLADLVCLVVLPANAALFCDWIIHRLERRQP